MKVLKTPEPLKVTYESKSAYFPHLTNLEIFKEAPGIAYDLNICVHPHLLILEIEYLVQY